MLGVQRPDPATPNNAENAYVFDRTVTFHHPDGTTSTVFIDLHKRGSFVLESKQGVEKKGTGAGTVRAGQARAKSAKKGTATRWSALWDKPCLAPT